MLPARIPAWDPVTRARTIAVDCWIMSSSVSCSSVVARTLGTKPGAITLRASAIGTKPVSSLVQTRIQTNSQVF